MSKQISKAKKENIDMKNEENTEKQRADVANAKALKKEQHQLAEEKGKLWFEVAWKNYEKECYWKYIVHNNSARIVKTFVLKLREKIWREKVAELAKLSPKKKIIFINSFTTHKIYGQSKTIYFIFEVVEKDGFKLDLSIYMNYICPKILSTLNMNIIRSSCESTLDIILKQYFSKFDETQVFNYISLTNTVYKNLIDEFSSEFYKSKSSSLDKCLINTFEKFIKTHNLDITKVSEYVGKTITPLYYENLAKKLYHTDEHDYDSYISNIYNYNRDLHTFEPPITFEASISYFNSCRQCNSKNQYAHNFNIGFDIKNKMHFIVYNCMTYTIVNMDDLFKQLLTNGLIYDKPICQNCCKKNEVDNEVSMVMSKLLGLVYIGEPKYEVTYPMYLYDNDYESNDSFGLEECITIKLQIESCQSQERFDKFQIIKTKSYIESVNYEEDEYEYEEITQYTARVPLYKYFELWTPVSDVTIAFRNMLITFGLCNRILTCRIPDYIFRYIFSFIMIPNITSDAELYKDIQLKQLDNSKLIENFVNRLNFYDFREFN